MDELIDNYLPLYQIRYSYTEDKDIHDLTIDEKYQLLLDIILPEVRKAIDRHMPRITGSKTFKPKSLSTVFQQEKNIYLVAFPVENPDTGEITVNAPDERAIAQSLHQMNNWSLMLRVPIGMLIVKTTVRVKRSYS